MVPKAPCAVQGTEVGAKAFYFPPASDGSRGGTFFVNTVDATSWGRFELEAMAFHEGVPGHHLQLAVAAELPDSIPEFRKHVHNSAYSEGWGLYSERLSDEMGLYSGPDRPDGHVQRRLDAGLPARRRHRPPRPGLEPAAGHRLHGRQLARSPRACAGPRSTATSADPGQATSYMVGRLEIQRMRREAEERQGDRFDVRRFHSAVLDSGALPLGVLDRVVADRLP